MYGNSLKILSLNTVTKLNKREREKKQTNNNNKIVVAFQSYNTKKASISITFFDIFVAFIVIF